MVTSEEKARLDLLRSVAIRMMAAARTAPKGRGVDNLSICMVEGEELRAISEKMRQLVAEEGAPQFFVRDAENLDASEVMVLVGTRIQALGVSYCGLCGFENCGEKSENPNHPCSFNTGDLGIAIGSAVSVAMEARIDNRVMFSAGIAARQLGLPSPDSRIIYGIPLSCTGKSPYFDRTWKSVK